MEKQNHIPNNRREALRVGAKLYFTGLPCKHGHIANRQAVNSTCCDCSKIKGLESYRKNRESRIARVSEYYKKNSEKIKNYSREYARSHKGKTNARHRDRYANDPSYKASFLVRKYIRKMMGYIDGSRKSSRSIKSLPYTPEEFVAHIEKMFLKGMTWDNHGEWHVDHIVPISYLISHGEADPAVINALSNLRPMWAKDNLVKGEKIVGLPL